jgi:hypothetical protein
LDSEADKFTFTLALPIEYVSTANAVGFSEDIAVEMNAYLAAFDLHVNAASLHLPPTRVDAKYCFVEGDSKLSYFLKHLYHSEYMIYDWDGFKLLEKHYDCPDYLAYCCIEFTCSLK